MAANRLPVILGGERQPTYRLIRCGWVDGRRRSDKVTCPYAAKPETSNLQRLSIYGVSPGMASRNFRAHRAGLDHLPVISLHELPFPAAPARTKEPRETLEAAALTQMDTG